MDESPRQAMDRLLERIKPTEPRSLPLGDCDGLVLREPLVADRPSPACDVSAMDGYALRLSDIREGPIDITGEIRIGREPPSMPTGSALRIVTGAPAPQGADVVVKREDTVEHADRIELRPGVAESLKPGKHIRYEGENRAAGDTVRAGGALITPAVAGVLASFGRTEPLVSPPLRVAIISTGDEVLDASDTPTRWQLRDGNGPGLCNMLGERRWLEPQQPIIVGDDQAAIADAVGAALGFADAIVLTAGVSMGDHDHVPAALQANGIERVFHRLPQRPGKPALGAIAEGGRPVLGLPGNPVSVLVTARRMLLPALARRAGLEPIPHAAHVRLTNPDDASIDLWWSRLVRLCAPGEAELISTKGSGDLASAAAADGFVEIPPGEKGAGPWPYFAW